MRYEWILDVLTDLRAFARTNGLAGLAERLDDAMIAAIEEIAKAGGGRGAGRAGEGDGADAP